MRQDTLIHLIHVSVSAVTGDKTFFILCFFSYTNGKKVQNNEELVDTTFGLTVTVIISTRLIIVGKNFFKLQIFSVGSY